MAKAIALKQYPGDAALESAKNFAKAAYDFMYGTKERANLTVWFCFGLLAVGSFMESTAQYAGCM